VEGLCEVVSVVYEPQTPRPDPPFPQLFWVEAGSRLVLRHQAEGVYCLPGREPVPTMHEIVLTRVAIDQPIAPEKFEYTPPKDAIEITSAAGGGSCGIVTGGGGGFSEGSGGKGVSKRHWSTWDGGTFVEQARWTFRGHEITIEQRWRLSDDEKEILLTERVTGPREETRRELKIPV
jgi:hypothetical protein